MSDDHRQREVREALDRVARDTETLGASSAARIGRRLSRHFAARDAVGAAEGGGTDAIEVWGRRIGRGLSLIGVVVLAIWLAVQLGLIS